MNAEVMVDGLRVQVAEIDGKRVLPLRIIDRLHGVKAGTTYGLFNTRLNSLRPGFAVRQNVDFFALRGKQAAQLGIVAPSGVFVLTLSGYIAVFGDSARAEVVGGYFQPCESKSPQTPPP